MQLKIWQEYAIITVIMTALYALWFWGSLNWDALKN